MVPSKFLLISSACSADDGMLIIWNLEDGSEEQTISVAFNRPVTLVAWISVSQGTPNQVFAFGTADGNLFTYAYHMVCCIIQPVSYLLTIMQNYYDFAFSAVAHNRVIENIAFDAFHKCLAIARNRCMKVWEINKKCRSPFSPPIVSPAYLGPVVAWHSVTTPPKSSITCYVSFLDEGCDILVGYLDSHEVYVP